MVNSFIAKKDLDSEMTVVRNEFEMGENDPASILEERVLSTAFLWHNYGKSTIGAKADLENVPIDRLQAFYRNYYQPDNAVLLVAGRFDEAKTLALDQRRRSAAIPKPDAHAAGHLHARADAGRRARRSRCGAWATCRRSPPRTTCPSGAHPGLAARRRARPGAGRHAVGPAATRRSSRRRRPTSCRRLLHGPARPGLR